MTAKTIQNYTKTVKTALSGKIGKVCVTVCFYNARSESSCSAQCRKHMVQNPCPAAQGAQPAPEAHGQVTWSGHMVYNPA